MALKQVEQVHGNGCFIAAVAMLLGKSYEDACKLVHPGQDPKRCVPGLRSNNIGKAAADVLKKLGCEVRPSRLRKLRQLKRIKKHALLILRWSSGEDYTDEYPAMCHAVVFDGETSKFLDPNGGTVDDYEVKFYQRSLDSVFYVEPPKAA